SVLLTASAESDSSDASIEIRPAGDMPTGTRIWSVSPTPGCKATKMTQAVPSANGPDLYVEESCPDGSMIRALTSDGRELWRRPFAAAAAPSNSVAGPVASGAMMGIIPNGTSSKVPGKLDVPGPEHVTHTASGGDATRVGMTPNEGPKPLSNHKTPLG